MYCLRCGVSLSPAIELCSGCGTDLRPLRAAGFLNDLPPSLFESANTSVDGALAIAGVGMTVLASVPIPHGILDPDLTGPGVSELPTSAGVDPEVTTMLSSPIVRRAGSNAGNRPRTDGAGTAAGGPLEVGQLLGTRYRIIRLLGTGGMGAVYHAWDAELEVALAFKVIRPDAIADPAAAAAIEARFKRELL